MILVNKKVIKDIKFKINKYIKILNFSFFSKTNRINTHFMSKISSYAISKLNIP
jgi:hypothetical protein